MLAVGQSLVYYNVIYAAGYFFSTELIIEERTSYDRAFRSVQLLPLLKNDAVFYCICVINNVYVFFIQGIFCCSFHSIVHQSS
jgi:hypothetical protein